MTKKFCSAYDMSTDGFKNMSMVAGDFGSKNMKDWTAKLWAEPTNGLTHCPITCEDTFNHFMDDKNCKFSIPPSTVRMRFMLAGIPIFLSL